MAERPEADTRLSPGGETYYVGAESCRDDGPGDKATPFCRFEAALAILEPGDTLNIAPGVYAGPLFIRGLRGRPEAPITVQGQDRETVIFDGGCSEFPCSIEDVEWEGDEETGVITIEDSESVTLRDVTVRNSLASGVTVLKGEGITLERITVNGTGHAGVLVLYASKVEVVSNDVGWIQQGWRDERGRNQPGAHESISIVGVTDFVVGGNYVHDSLKEGIDIKESSTDGAVEGNFVERMCAVGIYINEAHGVDVYRNRVRRSGYFLGEGREIRCQDHPEFGRFYDRYLGGGIQLAVGDLGELSRGLLSDIDVYQNVFWDMQGNGIEFWDELRTSRKGSGEMRGNRVFNNVIYSVSLVGIYLSDVTDTLVAGNIIANTEGDPFAGNAIDASTISHNLFHLRHDGQAPYGTEYVTGDPLFVDPTKGDFHLRADSPAIDRGLDMGLPAEGQPDIGAYEYGLH
jgi:parallel beta-helix repeat protein